MDSSLETALAALRQLRQDRQNGLITDRDYDRRIATLLQGQNAPALLALLQAEGGLPAPPPVVASPIAAPPAPPAPAPPAAAAAVQAAPEPPLAAAFGGRPVPPISGPIPSAQEDEAAAELGAPASSSTLNYVLLGGGILLLTLLVVYLMSGQRPSEHLTSASRTAADTTAAAPEVGPQAPQLALPPVAAPETVRVFPKTIPAPAVDSTAGAAGAAPATRPAPAADSAAASPAAPAASAPAETDAAAEQAVRTALASYYADLQAAPFDAGAHFAPAIERFLTLRATTPAAIADNLAANHFPEFQDYQARPAPGSLHVSPPAADGSRTATYVEVARSFRPSLQQHQQTRTRVRVRFTPDYKIDYLRQENVLENTMTPQQTP
ncbi:hypothetical protein ACFQ48_08250 [Hymenobacter caeli]|uniref:SHOCT domain-containing protein n=1 Tax=Hymenobacter caeli TaxID=2735894 RepID=A0ABX2FMI7_9BACT|nr:hypothetical protein [Hymenobacter caeli]NRT18236.1 hypothetical protein [Hymenobacter caeli]